ncbi:MAG: hypothetical protein J6S67_26205 [Methanobrevibacter sp.]|nr:hypothetical protein [Methanobrevibacter sp.]
MDAKFLIGTICLTFLTCLTFWACKIDTERFVERPTTKVIHIYIDGNWYCIPIIVDRQKHNPQDLEDLKNNQNNK